MDSIPVEILFMILGYADRDVRLVSKQWKSCFDYIQRMNGDLASWQWYLAENMVTKKQSDLFHLKNIEAYIIPIDHNKYIPILPKFLSYYCPSFRDENYCTFEKVPGTKLEVIQKFVIPDIITRKFYLHMIFCCFCLFKSNHYYFVEYQKAYRKKCNERLTHFENGGEYYSSDGFWD